MKMNLELQDEQKFVHVYFKIDSTFILSGGLNKIIDKIKEEGKGAHIDIRSVEIHD